VPELLDYDSRFLASPRDPEALAAGALYAAAHPRDMAAVIDANKRRVRAHYDKRGLHERYRTIYASLLEGEWRA
ncbi:MAG TPA: hypothetical protein PK625_01375, partial [Spirochaetales bacterium]|nr:hypothetical protein [Spirochaetales bacterium]